MNFSTIAKEGSYEAAKWLHLPILIDAEELAELFSQLGVFVLIPLGKVLCNHQFFLSQKEFCASMHCWIETLKRGEIPPYDEIRSMLSCAWTKESNDLYAQKIDENRSLVKIRRPVVQIQSHFFSYSQKEKTIHSGVFGKETIFWGFQCSYPQIFFDPTTQTHRKVDEAFPNTSLFRVIQKWVRNATSPLILHLNGEKKAFPIRLGKRCHSWIHLHPQLISQGLQPWATN